MVTVDKRAYNLKQQLEKAIERYDEYSELIDLFENSLEEIKADRTITWTLSAKYSDGTRNEAAANLVLKREEKEDTIRKIGELITGLKSRKEKVWDKLPASVFDYLRNENEPSPF